MPAALTLATVDQASLIATLRNAVAEQLTARHGVGHWSSISTEHGIRTAMKRSTIYLCCDQGGAIATLQLATKKPWAIDRRYFTAVARPLYLLGLAVAPSRQGCGVGRRCLDEAVILGRAWPADSLCLDAYDAAAGAAGFYRKCGFAEVGRADYRHTALIYFERLLNA
jgi:ribosomal protein S18 acetylase RimI-like enzyme